MNVVDRIFKTDAYREYVSSFATLGFNAATQLANKNYEWSFKLAKSEVDIEFEKLEKVLALLSCDENVLGSVRFCKEEISKKLCAI